MYTLIIKDDNPCGYLDPEERREYQRKYHREYYKKNKAKLALNQKEYQQTFKEHLKEIRHEYYLENKEKCKAYHKKWVKNNPEEAVLKARRYYRKRAIKKANEEWLKRDSKEPKQQAKNSSYMDKFYLGYRKPKDFLDKVENG